MRQLQRAIRPINRTPGRCCLSSSGRVLLLLSLLLGSTAAFSSASAAPRNSGTEYSITGPSLVTGDPPTISLTPLVGTQSNDITISYVLSDAENDTLGLRPRYSVNGGSTWLLATVTGDTSDIPSDAYTGNLVWHSDTDLPGQSFEQVLFRLIPFDDTSDGSPDQISFPLDNKPPESIAVGRGASGDSTFTFWFDEEVADSTATNTSNISLSGGLTVGSIQKVDNHWTIADSLPTPRDAAAAAVIDGKLYVVGGIGDQNALEVYDPETGNWSTKASSIYERYGAVAAAYNGKLYVAGGTGGGGFEVYDPETNTWTDLGYGSGEIYCAGGVINGKLYFAEASNLYEYDLTENTENPKTAMSTPRWETAYGLIDGKLYVAGGTVEGTSNKSSVLEVYNPSTDIWTTKASMPRAVTRCAGAVFDGRLYVAGGYTNGTPTDTVYVYDPDSDSWAVEATMSIRRGYPVAAWIRNKLYLAGGDKDGNQLGRLEVYRPWVGYEVQLTGGQRLLAATDVTVTANNIGDPYGNTITSSLEETFTPMTSDVPELIVPSMTGIHSGDIPISLEIHDHDGNPVNLRCEYSTDGGSNWNTATVSETSSNIYPINYSSSLTWQSKTDLDNQEYGEVLFRITPWDNPYANGQPSTLTFGLDNKPPDSISAGGWRGYDTVNFWFDESVTDASATNTAHISLSGGLTIDHIEVDSTFTLLSSTPTGRTDAAAAVMDGRLYVIGGQQNDRALEVYEPLTDTWTTLASSSQSHQYSPLAAAIDGKLYVVGGNSEMEIYDPATDSWSNGPGAPGGAPNWVTGGMIDGKLYMAAGEWGGPEVKIYDPATGNWTTGASIPTTRHGAVAGVIDGILYVVGGDNGGGSLSTLEAYDPDTDNWTTRASAPSPVAHCAAGVIDGELYVADPDTMYVYDPGSDSWAVDAVMPRHEGGTTGGVIRGRFYVAGGDGNTNRLEAFNPQEGYVITLSGSQVLPSAETSVTITASNINDLHGNTATTSIQTSFNPATGATPGIELDPMEGNHGGDVTISYVITDPDGSPVSLQGEYSTDGGNNWNTATLSGTTSEIYPDDYRSSLVWQSRSDLSGQEFSEVIVRITPRDNETEQGTPRTVSFALDNKPPDSISVSGYAGHTSLTFWFSEPVQDTSATSLSNISLTGGLSADTLSVDKWKTRAQAPAECTGSASAVIDGKLYVVGGENHGNPMDVYDPDTDTWTELAHIRDPRVGHSACAIDGKLYVVGCRGNLEIYDPATNTWSWGAWEDKTQQSWGAAGAIDGKLYYVGGEWNWEVIRYDPLTNTWTSRSQMPTVRQAGAYGVIEGKLYVAGGEAGGTYYSVLEVYDPAIDSWSTRASMPEALAYAASGVIRGRLYVAGGHNGTDFSDKLYVYDPATDSWSVETTVQDLRWKATAAAIGDDLHIIGGFYGTYTTAHRVYNPRIGYKLSLGDSQVIPAPETQLTITASNITDWYGNTATTPIQLDFYPQSGQTPSISLDWPYGVQKSNITISYEISDSEGNPVSLATEYSTDRGSSWQAANVTGTMSDIYPANYQGSLTWNTATDLADQEANLARFRITPSDNATTPGQPASIIVDIDNRAPIWIAAEGASGDTTFMFWFNEPVTEATAANTSNYSLSGGYGIDSVEVNNAWEQVATIAPTRAWDAGVVEVNGKLYVVGGHDGSNYLDRLEIYDPSTDSWTTLASTKSPRASAVVAGLNGKLYLLSGDNAGGRVNAFEVYDTDTNTWSSLAAPPLNPASWDAQARGIGCKLYVSERSDPPHIYIYDPENDSWESIEGGLNAQYVATAVINGKFYIAGGQYDNGNFSNELKVFDPATGVTTPLTNMPTPRQRAVGGVIEGKFYVVGGHNHTGSLSTVEIYDPPTGEWTTGPDMPFQRSDYMGDAVGARFYYGKYINWQGTENLVFDVLDKGLYELTLESGQKLPPPPNTITLTASNISDWIGNTLTTPIDTAFTSSSGQPPSITIYGPSGAVSGDISIQCTISDPENNPVWLEAEYQLAGESTWHTASVAGDTDDIPPSHYSGTITWKSRDDLLDQVADRIRFRLTPRDNETSPGTADTIIVNIDNLAPSWIAAEGRSGGGTLAFWFDEPVQEDTATETGNISLLGGLTVDNISTIENWDNSATTAPTRRWSAGVGVMDDKLYVAGGQDEGGYYSTVEVYDPEADTWSSLPDMPTPRQAPHVYEINGKLYVISGHDQIGWVSVLEVYDPDTNSWDSRTTEGQGSWWNRNGAVINGKLYLNTGNDPAQIAIYDPHTDSWEYVDGGLPHGNVAVGALDGKLYIAGGWHHNGQYYAQDLVVFDPVDGSTTWKAWMPTAQQSAAGAIIDGKFYVIGGHNDSGERLVTEIYDPETNMWSTGLSNTRRINQGVGGVINGQVYMAVWDSDWNNYTAFDVYSRDRYQLNLATGQTIPSPPDSVTITASNITDWYGNTTTVSLDTSFTPSTGQPPAIALYPPSGVLGGDITARYEITDAEGNPVWLKTEYQLQGETTWQPATVQGDTTGIPATQYDGSLIWNSATDLPDQIVHRARFKITPRDNPATAGTAYTIIVTFDNLAPTWISAEGSSGDSTITFSFNEPVTESSATDTGNFSLSGSLTVSNISTIETWDYLATTAPTKRWDVGVGVMDNKLYVAGGFDDVSYYTTVEVYDPESDTWSLLPDMPTPRQSPHVFAINGKLYVISGHDQNGWVSVLEVYDPDTNSWTSHSTESQGAWWDRNGAVINGKLYLNTGDDPAQITVYDPFIDSWERIPGGLSHGSVAAGAIDGKLYLVGGWHHNGQYHASDLVVFDPADNSTTWLAWMPTPRQSAIGAVIDGRFYVVNGSNDDGNLNLTEIYDPETNLWTTGSAHTRRGTWSMGGVIDGKLYFPVWDGDWTDSYTAFDVYSRDRYQLTLSSGQTIPSPPDSVTITASNITDWPGNTTISSLEKTFAPSTGQPPAIALYPPSGVLGGNITVGYQITDNENNPVSLLAEYRLPGESFWYPATVTGDTTYIPASEYDGSLVWNTTTDLPNQRLRRVRFRITPCDRPSEVGTVGVTLVDIDNQAPASISAEGTSGDTTITFWFDEPVRESSATEAGNYSLSGGLTAHNVSAIETWDFLATTAPTRREFAGVCAMNGKVYVVGGWFDPAFYATVEVYDPATDSWTQLPDMPTPRRSPFVFVIDGLLYAIGGSDFTGDLDVIEVYDPESNSWTSRTTAAQGTPWARHGVVIDGKIYLNTGRDPAEIAVYDPHTDRCDYIPGGLPHEGVAAGVVNGKLYLAGGWHHGGQYYASDLVVFDPADNSTTWKTNMPTARWYATGAVLDGKFYVINGDDASGTAAVTEIYNPETDIWQTSGLTYVPGGSTGISVVINGKLYLVIWDDNYTDHYTAFDIYSRNCYRLELADGEYVSGPPDSVAVTASGITDLAGNTITADLDTFFIASTGTAPSVALFPPAGVRGGDLTFHYRIHDAENNLVSLRAEYQLLGEETWQSASVSGTTTSIPAALYEGILVWQSGTDLAGQVHTGARFRLTPYDNETTDGTPGIALVDIDNRAPAAISAEGTSGDSTITFWFDEPVTETSATNTDNITLSDGFTVESVEVRERWTEEQIDLPDNRSVIGLGALNGKLYAVGGYDGSDYCNRVDVYDPTAGTWSQITGMPTYRSRPIVVGLNGLLYVLGGEDDSQWFDILEVFDPENETWSTLMNVPFSGTNWSAQAAAINGLIYVYSDGGIHIYDPDLDSWETIEGGIEHPNQGSAIGVIDGKLYIAGGYHYHDDWYRSDLVVFDPETRTTAPLASMNWTRTNAVGAVIDGRFYVVGGWDQNGSVPNVVSYDPETGQWTESAVLLPHDTDVAGVVVGGRLYTPWWAGDPTTFDVYDRDTFTLRLDSGQRLPSPPNSITVTASNITDHFGNTTVGDLSIDYTPSTGQAPSTALYQPTGMQTGDITIHYVISDDENNPVWLKAEYQLPGESFWNVATIQGDTTEITYGQYTGYLTWNSGTDLPDQRFGRVQFRITPRDNPTTWGTSGTTLIDLDNLAPLWITAEATSGDNSITFWFNEPVSESTATNAGNFSLPGGLTVGGISIIEAWDYLAATAPTKRDQVGVGVLDGQLYVVGGWDDVSFHTTVEVYDPESDTWSSLPDMPTPRQAPHVYGINGKLYVVGGHDQNGWVEKLEVYDPDTNSWISRTTEGQGSLWDRNGAVINGRIYLNTGNDPPEIHVYDPHTDSWEYIAGGLPHGGVAVGVIDGKLYLAGGWHHNGQYHAADLVVFDPVTQTTTHLAQMPSARNCALGAVIDGKFYVISGSNDSGSINVTEIYDPQSNMWTTGLARTHSNWDRMIGGVINGKIYHGLWNDGFTNYYTAFDVYSRNKYELTLDSGQTLPFERLTLQASGIQDWCGNEASTLLTDFVPDDQNSNPSINLDDISDEVSGDVDISYTITDSEGDQIRLVPEYSIDGEATWSRATTSPDTVDIGPSAYQGNITWFSENDLSGQDIQDVRFRLTPWDNVVEWGSSGAITLHVDNNDVPSATITSSSSSRSDTTWTFDYELSDAESDALSLMRQYSPDDGATWYDATTTGDTENIASGAYTGSLIWQVERDLPQAVQWARFRIVPNDNDTGTAGETNVFLNAVDIPIAEVTSDLSGEQNTDISIDFSVTDEESDPIQLEYEYLAPDANWYQATVTGDTELPDPSYYSGTVVWHSTVDLPGTDLENAAFRITPSDPYNQGLSAEVTFHLDNNDPPSASLDTPVGVQARDVEFSCTLSDTEGDGLSIQAWWSDDHGTGWQPMTIKGTTTGINPDQYELSVIWKSLDDCGYGQFDSLLAKLVPSDLDPGTEVQTAYFSLINYAGDYSGDRIIDFSDFATLVTAWNEQNTYHDIGPATGSPPDLLPTGDGIINFEDLAVYLLMWTWSAANQTAAEEVLHLTRPAVVHPREAESKRTIEQQHPVVLEQPRSTDVWQPDDGLMELNLEARDVAGLTSAGIVLHYDVEYLKFLDVQAGTFLGRLDNRRPSQLFLKRVDEETGRIELMLGRIDPENPQVGGSGRLATLRFEKLSKENSVIDVGYDLRNPRAQVLASGSYQTTVQAIWVPDEFALLQNYPNPFNGETTIRFQLPAAQRVQLYIFNVRGQRVATLLDRKMDPGYHSVTWSGRNDADREVASGIYIYLIQAGPHRQSKKLTLIK